jgi:hypothetical protein
LGHQVVRQYALLNLINRSATLVSDRLEATPNQQDIGNKIAANVFGTEDSVPKTFALNPGFTALTSFHACELVQLAVKLMPVTSTGGTPAQCWLLNLPTDTRHILYSIYGSLRSVVGRNKLRPVGRNSDSE